MPDTQKPNKREKDSTKIVNARVSEDILKALSIADDDSDQFDFYFTLTGVIKKALDDKLNEIHHETGIDYYKLIKWKKKIKDRFETDSIQSVVTYDNWTTPPWILEAGSAFNLIFKNYSTLEVPNTTTSDSVSYLNPNASTWEKDYFRNTLKKAYTQDSIFQVGPIWNPYNADGLQYNIKEALESLSNYIFELHFLDPVIHINVTQEHDETDDLSMMKSQIVHYLKQHPQVISFCSCSKVQGGRAALWVHLKSLKNGLDFKILFDNVKHEIYDDVPKFDNFDDLLEAKEKQLIDTWHQAYISLKSKEEEVKLQHQVDIADNKLELIRESMNIGDWSNYLLSETNKPYFKSLNYFLSSRFEKNIDIYPPKDYWFKALEYSSFDNTKVIILGQDPYHGEDQAEGLSFSVPKGIPIPPSLRNIYEELETDDVEFNKPSHGNLISWAKQGVLLLNSVLTVEKNTPTSHTNIGWEIFTDQIIKNLSKNKNNLVFILWGTYANTKYSLIDSDKHLVLESFHPSPFSATKKGKKKFFGCKHFSKTNNYLKENDIETINWSIPK